MTKAWVLAAALAASACATTPTAPSQPAAASGPAAATGTDGRYVGIARLMRATIRGCPRSGARVVVVDGNALSLNYRGATVAYALAAIVAPGGGIHGSDGRGTIEGQITGTHMDLTVSSEFCEVRYALERG